MAYQLSRTDEQEMITFEAMIHRKAKATHQRPDGTYYTYTTARDLFDQQRAEGSIWGVEEHAPQFNELIARYYRLEEYRKRKGEPANG